MTGEAASMWFWTVIIGAGWIMLGFALAFVWGAFVKASEEDDE